MQIFLPAVPILATVLLTQFYVSKGFSFERRILPRGEAGTVTPSGCYNQQKNLFAPQECRRLAHSFSLGMSSDSDPDSNTTNNVGRGKDGGKIFDEASYEKDRLAKDAQAMDAMKALGDAELSKDANSNSNSSSKTGELRSPWKWELRKRIWDYMEEKDIARFPRPVHHRIPNFVGAERAAKNLSELPEFVSANIIKVNPDTPQRPVRDYVLRQGKKLLTPQPRLRTGFFSTIDMKELPSLVEIEQCTNSKGVVKYGTPITLNEEYTVDLVVVGSTAVCPRTGARVGKGEGFAELEWGILSAQGNLDAETCLVVTTVHDCQVVEDEEDMPEGWALTQHDVPVDIIVTPTRVIKVSDRAPKPSGIFWDLLSPQKLAAIRVLRQLKQETEETLGASLPSGPDEQLPPVASRNNRKGSNNKKDNGKGQRQRKGPQQKPPVST